MLNKKKFFYSISIVFSSIVLFFIFTSFFNLSANENNEFINANDIFKDESEFQDYVLNKIKFKDISFKEVFIERRDNFWKVAKRNKVNIDTLIAANPFWKDLRANIHQKLIVPSTKGTLHFIDNFTEIEKLKNEYEVKQSDIIIQETSAFYEYYYKFKKNRKPLAVFIIGAKPITDIMSEEMAEKFAIREKFRSPLSGRLSSFFGKRKHPIFKTKKLHNGLDIAAKYGAAVGASRSGTVIFSGWNGGYGKAVIIQHAEGYRTLYGHMSKIYARVGQKVKAGKLIGRVGSTGYSTGPHLHFTIWKHNKLINPLKILW